MGIENDWMETTLDNEMSIEDKRSLAVHFVGLVLEGMVSHKYLVNYKKIDKETYPKNGTPFTPDFLISFDKQRRLSLYVAVDQDEFKEMGQTLSYDSSVLRIFDENKIMMPRDIVTVLKRKLIRAVIVRRKVQTMVEDIMDN